MDEDFSISTVVISAYNFEKSYGSEPMTAFGLIQQSLQRFQKVIVLTSNLTRSDLIADLENLYKSKIDVYVVDLCSIRMAKHPIFFYPAYRNWQKRIRKFLNRNSIKYDLAIHASLGTFLFGTGLSARKGTYVYGPAGFSLFNYKYARAYGKHAFLELFRNMVLLIILIFDPFVRRSLNDAKMVIAGDEQVSKILKRTNPKAKVFEKPIIHYIQQVETGDPSSPHVIGQNLVWVGRFLKRKEPLFGIQVLEELRKFQPNIHLKMIGNGPLLNSLKSYVRSKGLEKNITFLGWIEKDQVLENIRSSNLMIFTSFRETAGVQLFEARDVGCRIVALGATGASKWYIDKSIQYIDARFFESRKSLINRFTLAVKSNLEEDITMETRINQKKEENLIAEILNSIS